MKKKREIKLTTTIIYGIVSFLKLESFFVNLSKWNPLFLKFIPQPLFYKTTDYRVVKRDGVLFKLEPFDFVQWYILAGMEDNSWKYALDVVEKNSIVLDVGANSGAFCLKLAMAIKGKNIENVKIFAFEPNPYVFKRLKNNLDLNPGLEKIVVLFPFGLGDKNQFLNFQFDHNNSGKGSFLNANTSVQTKLEIRKLDDFVKDYSNKVTFMKIDVEGFEPLVIKGANGVIDNMKPGLYIEVTDEWFRKNNSSASEILNYFENRDYKLFGEIENELLDLNDFHNKSKILQQFQFNLLVK